jgi:integrase
MGVKIRISHGKIFLDVYVPGHRKWESTGLSVSSDPRQQKEVMRLAEVLRSKREVQIVTGTYNLIDHIKNKQTLYSYAKEYAKKLGKGHALHYALKHLKNYPGGETIKLSEITTDWVENYKDYLVKDCEIKSSTASLYMTSLKQTLNKAVRENLILKNPAKNISPIKTIEPERVFLSDEQLEKLGKSQVPGKHGPEIKKAFIFSCYTGLRISDIKTLKWGEIHHSATETRLIKRLQKTKSVLDNPIPNASWELIDTKQDHDPDEFVFPSLASKITRFPAILAEWGERSKVGARISWHVARRTFALRMLDAGADIYTVSKLLVHKKVSTTQKYLRLSPKLSKAAVGNIKEIKISDSEDPPPDPTTHSLPYNDSETQTSPNPPD